MRVLIVDSGKSWRGGQGQAFLLSQGLRERGHGVTVVAPESSPLSQKMVSIGIPVRPINQSSELDLLSGVRLARLSKEIEPDIVHAHTSRSLAVARLAQLLGLKGKLVVTRHLTRRPMNYFKYHRGVSRFIAVSNAVQSSLESAGIPESSIDVVRNGVRLQRPQSNNAAPRTGLKGPVSLVAIGALTPEKNYPTLIEAAKLAQIEGANVRWTVLGEGRERARLSRLIKKTSVPVELRGHVPDVSPYLAEASALVHTATAEALGSGILEALAMGVPVVATRVGGIPEVITPEVGTLVDPTDASQIWRETSAWITDPPGRDAVREKGPKVAARFDVDLMIEGTLRSYDKALNDYKSLR